MSTPTRFRAYSSGVVAVYRAGVIVGHLKGVKGKWAHDVVPFFGAERPIGSITTDLIADFKAARFEAGDSGKTVNRKLALVSKLLHLAVEWEMIDKVPVIRREREGQGRVRWVLDAEEATLVAYLRASTSKEAADFADLVVVLVDTGLRLAEGLRLEDRHVSDGKVHVWVTKSNKPRTVGLTARAAAILQRRMRREPDRHASLAGSSRPFGHLTHDRCGKLWAEARTAMGLAQDDQFVIHALRHAFAMRMIDSGLDIRKLQVLMGHAKVTTTEIYAHVSPAAAADAVGLLEARAKRVAEEAAAKPALAIVTR